MQGRQHQVPGQRGLNGDLGGFAIADFAHQHYVRILAQDGTQAAGEGHLDFGVDLGLAYALQLILHRIFNGHDVALPGVEAAEGGVERRAFPGAGRTGDQDDAVRAGDQRIDPIEQGGRHAQRQQIQVDAVFVQQTQDDAFAVAGGQGGDAHVDCSPADAQRHAAILRDPLFGNVQTGHHLDARN